MTERFKNVHQYCINIISFEAHVFHLLLSTQHLRSTIHGSDYSPQSFRTPKAMSLSFTPAQYLP